MPGAANAWVAKTVLPVVPSPKFQLKELRLPSGSNEPWGLKLTGCPAVAGLGATTNPATGGVLAGLTAAILVAHCDACPGWAGPLSMLVTHTSPLSEGSGLAPA